MITLQKLKFNNMFSYGKHNEIDLNNTPVTQLLAINGVGKTSLSLIIQELLFSKNVQGIKKDDILNKFCKENEWDAEITFTNTIDNYKVCLRRKNNVSKLHLYKNGEDISDHTVPNTYKNISNILGMDFKVFSQLTYQSSHNILEFLKATDTNRKKFLINLFNLEKYIEIGEEVKLKLNKLEKESYKIQGEYETINNFLNTVNIGEKHKLKDIDKNLIDTSLYTELHQLEEKINNHKNIITNIQKNNVYKEELENIKQKGLNFVNMKKPDFDEFNNQEEDLKDINERITEINNIIKQNKQKINSLDISDICYACKQPIDNSKVIELKEEIEKEIDLNSKQLEPLKMQKNSIIETIQELTDYINTYNEVEKIYNRVEVLMQIIDNTLPDTPENIDDIKNEYNKINATLNKQIEQKEKLEKENNLIIQHNAKIDALVQQKREYLAQKELITDSVKNIKIKVDNLTILKKAFSTSGIVAYKLESLIKELESQINTYLLELSDGQFQIIFSLDKDKLNIVLYNNGVTSPIENISSGEFSRVQTAVLLAIRKLLTKIVGNSINLLFLDEITGVLDEIGKEKLIEILLNEEDLNVFLISHDYTHPLLEKIEIIKENNISRIL